MALDPQEFAQMLGAEIIGEVPDVGGGPFGMARLAHIMHERLTPSRGERPGRPTDPSWVTRCKVPMSDATLRSLEEMAEAMSTAERKVSPMQVAAQLLEEAVGRVGVQAEAVVSGAKISPGLTTQQREPNREAGEQSPRKPIPIRPSRREPREEGKKASHRRKNA